MLNLPKLNFYIGDYINKINTQIEAVIYPDFINSIANQVAMGGKRMRPIILILISKMLGSKSENLFLKAATAIELIHLASLLHDDVVDQSNLRHNKQTAHVIFGNQQTILAGDYLFAESFKKMVETENLEILQIISTASSILASGELQQLQLKDKKFKITLEDYSNIIYKKTASLFESSAKIGAILANSQNNSQNVEKAAEFGKCIGMAFQIIDDLLDYTSTKTKKKIGTDFYENKITLPIIFALSENSKLNNTEKTQLKTLFLKEEKLEEDFAQTLSLLQKSNAIENCFTSASNYCNYGKKIIQEIGGNSKESVIISEIIDFFLERQF